MLKTLGSDYVGEPLMVMPTDASLLSSPTPPPILLKEKPPVRKTSDSRDRVDESLRYLLPQDSNVPYDMKHVIKKVRQRGKNDKRFPFLSFANFGVFEVGWARGGHCGGGCFIPPPRNGCRGDIFGGE